MAAPDIRGPSPYDSDLDINECVEKYLPLILALAKKEAPDNIGPVDSEDIAQEAFIKLLVILRKQAITFPHAYIRRIVHTVVVDSVRKYKPHLYQALPVDEEGEIQEGNVIVSASAELGNPEAILEEKEALDELMKELMEAISSLYPRQMHSTICTLKDRIDDLIQFVDALQENGIDSELQWPETKVERQLLRASYSPARRKVASYMLVDLSLYK